MDEVCPNRSQQLFDERDSAFMTQDNEEDDYQRGRREALEEAARICRDEAMLCRRDMRLVPAVTAETCASLIRALLSKPAKGE